MGSGSPGLTTLIYVTSSELPWPYSDIAVPCPVPALNCRSSFLACAVDTGAEPFPGVPTVPSPRAQAPCATRCEFPSSQRRPQSSSLCSQTEDPAGRGSQPQGTASPGVCLGVLSHSAHPAGTRGPGSTRRVWAAVRSLRSCAQVCVCTLMCYARPRGCAGPAGVCGCARVCL